MDVKYTPSDWEKMKDGIGDLIGQRPLGQRNDRRTEGFERYLGGCRIRYRQI